MRIPQEGSNLDRLALINRDMAELRKRIDQMSGREGLTSHKRFVRLAKTTSVGTYPSSGDTFSIIFVDGEYTEAEGNQTPTYTARQNAAGDYWVHNLAEEFIPNNTYLLVVFEDGQWWTFYKTGSSSPIIRFQLTAIKHYAGDATGKLVEWDGADYTATGAAFTIYDTYGVWGRAEIGWYGWAIQMDDRGEYEILWCQGWPRHINVLLYENMGATTSQHADATVVKAWGDADNGAGVTDLVGQHIDVYDIRNRWPWATTGQSAYCVYYEILHQYYVEELPETVGYGYARGTGTQSVSGGTTVEFGGWDNPHQQKNLTFAGPRKRWVIGTPGIWEAHASVSIEIAANITGNQAGSISIYQYRGGVFIYSGNSGGFRFNGRNNSASTSDSYVITLQGGLSAFGIFNCLPGDELVVMAINTESNSLTFTGGSFTVHLLEPSSTARAVLPAPLIVDGNQMRNVPQNVPAQFQPLVQVPPFNPFF